MDMTTERRAARPATLRTGELAERAGVNAQTLRYYERRGLLPEPPRTEAGHRRYPASAVSRILFIKRAQDLGFTLEEIEDLLSLRVRPERSCEAVQRRATRRRREVERKIATLQRLREVLDELIARCEAERATDECPILESLEGGEDAAPPDREEGVGR